jgi:ADP-ribosylation factor-like protein 2
LLQQERLAGASLLVFANKQDMEGSLVAAEISKVLELHNQQYENRHWSIQSCSAVTGQGLVEGMDWLVEDISSRIFLLS